MTLDTFSTKTKEITIRSQSLCNQVVAHCSLALSLQLAIFTSATLLSWYYDICCGSFYKLDKLRECGEAQAQFIQQYIMGKLSKYPEGTNLSKLFW